jgi:hypothetical protein
MHEHTVAEVAAAAGGAAWCPLPCMPRRAACWAQTPPHFAFTAGLGHCHDCACAHPAFGLWELLDSPLLQPALAVLRSMSMRGTAADAEVERTMLAFTLTHVTESFNTCRMLRSHARCRFSVCMVPEVRGRTASRQQPPTAAYSLSGLSPELIRQRTRPAVQAKACSLQLRSARGSIQLRVPACPPSFFDSLSSSRAAALALQCATLQALVIPRRHLRRKRRKLATNPTSRGV